MAHSRKEAACGIAARTGDKSRAHCLSVCLSRQETGQKRHKPRRNKQRMEGPKDRRAKYAGQCIPQDSRCRERQCCQLPQVQSARARTSSIFCTT
jgi:hypothetical protein